MDISEKDDIPIAVEEAFTAFDPRTFASSISAQSEKSSTGSQDAAISTFKNDDGLTLSAISNRSFLRHVVSRIGPLEGKRVFEIGSGTGYLACVLARLCGPNGAVVGCEIIPELFQASQKNPQVLNSKNLTIKFGDFTDVLPEMGIFDVIVGTSSFSLIAACIVNALGASGSQIVLPIEIPGGGDCLTVFERDGSALKVKHSVLSVSVPSTGRYSRREFWAPPVRRIMPSWESAQKTVIRFPQSGGTSISSTIAFRSFLLFSEPLFQAVNLKTGHLSRSEDMAFGLIYPDRVSCFLQCANSFILSGRRALELGKLFETWRSRWMDEGRPSLATYRYLFDVRADVDFEFAPALKTRVRTC